MNFVGNIGLIIFTMLGYSVGRILPGKKYHVLVELYDGGILIALWISAILLNYSNKWVSIFIWFACALLIGAVLTLALRSKLSPATITKTNKENMNFFKKIWGIWSAFSLRMGNFQGRLILLLFYFSIFAPFGIIYKLFRDPLHLRSSSEKSLWVTLSKTDETIENARRQY